MFRVPDGSLVRTSKFMEGILVGGHILVIVFSLCGNIGALFILVTSRAPRLSTKYFLLLLAFSDLLMTVTAPPTEIVKLMNDYNAWVFGKLLCKLVPFLQMVAATMSAMCLMAIAVERNLLIFGAIRTTPMGKQGVYQKWAAWITTLMTIVIPVACALPSFWSYQHVDFIVISNNPGPPTTPSPETTISPTVTSSCEIRYWCRRTTFDSRNIAYFGVTGATNILLLVCFLLCYVSIFRFVKKYGAIRKHCAEQQSAWSTTTSSGPAQSQDTLASSESATIMTADRHRKILRLILFIIFLYVCCRLPNFVFLVVSNVTTVPYNQSMLTLQESFHLLSSINSALNPFLYVIWNHSLRPNESGGDSGHGSSCCSKNNSCCKKFRHAFRYIRSCCRYQHRTIQQSDLHPFRQSPASDPDAVGRSSFEGRGPQVFRIVTSDMSHDR